MTPETSSIPKVSPSYSISKLFEEIAAFECLPRDPLHRTVTMSHLDPFPPRTKPHQWKPQDFLAQFYFQMGFDPNRLLNWRFEHKLVQALLFQKYSTSCVPETRGLFAEMKGLSKEEIRSRLVRLRAEGFLIKESLGEQSGESAATDKIDYIINEIDTIKWLQDIEVLTEEIYIVQRKLVIKKEYRVHSLEDEVIPDLTFYRYSRTPPDQNEIEAVNSYVKTLLQSLPIGLTSSALFGWDIALVEEGNFSVVEANPTGYHTVSNPGFQCSGYFHSAESIARLLSFASAKYQVTFNIVAQEIPSPGHDLHWWVNKSLTFLQSQIKLKHMYGISQPAQAMKWIDVRLSPPHNVFNWVVNEIQTMTETTDYQSNLKLTKEKI